LPELWLNDKTDNLVFPSFKSPPEGGVTAWYTMRINALGADKEEEFALDMDSAIRIYEERDAQRCLKWRQKFLFK
jgi:hypothetical protein